MKMDDVADVHVISLFGILTQDLHPAIKAPPYAQAGEHFPPSLILSPSLMGSPVRFKIAFLSIKFRFPFDAHVQ